MTDEYYALVKWIGGPDDGLYTAGVPVAWIKDLNIATFENEDPDTSYVVEWRRVRKPSTNEWNHFDAQVIEVSKNVASLRNKLKALDAQTSPYKPLEFDNLQKKKRTKPKSPVEPECKKKRKNDDSGKKKKGKDAKIQNFNPASATTSSNTEPNDLRRKQFEGRRLHNENKNDNSEIDILQSESDDDDDQLRAPALIKKMYKQLKEIKASQTNFMRDYARARNNDDENQNDQVPYIL
ncbi:hypothetical protein KQX54_013187 [Cotesia glomerata]|uniref:Chromo domain-containing protein n=1 Tax=Cotesia glomerata TaxID=32391 RepID=A0AAV7I8W8_COTGL|nr:hypothetical protein KQX54_013187 [Cotesia glomerata]